MMSRFNGHVLNELEHIKQSIQDILTTPIGSRVMRRDYGSLLPMLIDAPLNETTLLQARAAAVTAILRCEDRISIDQITVHKIENGKLIFDMQVRLSSNSTLQDLQIPAYFGAVT